MSAGHGVPALGFGAMSLGIADVCTGSVRDDDAAVALIHRAIDRNLALADRVRELAGEKGRTPAQLALAWLIRRHDDGIPIPGTSSIAGLEENVADVRLTPEDPERIERAAPTGAAAGERSSPEMLELTGR